MPNSHFWKMAKIKKTAKTGPFFVKMAPVFVLQLSLPKTGHFHFQAKKIVHKQNCWWPCCIFAKNAGFDFVGPLCGPQT